MEKYKGIFTALLTPLTKITGVNEKELEKLVRFNIGKGVKGLYLIDGATLVSHQSQFFTDGLHPNDNGHGCYAENLLAQIRPYL